MIKGIGLDIIEIARIRGAIERFGKRFIQRIYTGHEIANAAAYPAESIQFYAFLAKRFAAKEALAKALGFGIGEQLSFLDIEVLNDAAGKPYIDGNFGGCIVHLSLTDTKEYAAAMVTLEKVA